MKLGRNRLAVALMVVAVLTTFVNPTLITWSQGQAFVTIRQTNLDDFPVITIPLAVTNASGVPVLNLQADSFEVFEDDRPVAVQAVTAHTNSDLSIAVALVLDLSRSAPIDDIRTAAHHFLDSLGPRDRVALIGFNTPPDFGRFDPTKEVDFTSDVATLRQVVDGLTSGGSTALYEAVHKGVLITAEEIADRRAVVVVTDGHDTSSRSSIATAETPRTAAREQRVPIFTFGVYDPAFSSDPDYLNVLARETGGRYQEVVDSDDLEVLFQGVVAQLRSEYLLTTRAGIDQDGEPHVLRVRAITPQGVGDAQRTVTYPSPPPIPSVTRLHRDVNGQLRAVEAGTELRGRVLLVPQITAQNPLDRVEYYVDSVLQQTIMVDSSQGSELHESWEWTWDTRRLTEGEYLIEIIAYDDAGNVSDRFSTTIVVDRTWVDALGGSIWLVVGIVAAVTVLAILALLFLHSRSRRCPDCGRVMDSAWGGVCQFCSPLSEGPPTIVPYQASPESSTVPQAATAQQPEYAPTAVMQGGSIAMGRHLAAQPHHRTERIRQEPKAMSWVIVEKGHHAGREFRLHEGTTIGREGDNDIVLDDPAVSRRQAKIRSEGESFVIFDLGSTNPTEVNGREIGKHQLVDGDRIKIGNTVLVFKQVKVSPA